MQQEGYIRVAESRKPLSDAFPDWQVEPTLANLTTALKGTQTITELFKLANDDDFKEAVATLKPEDVKALRAVYKEMQTNLDGKVRLDTFDGQIVNIVGIDWWHSDQYQADGVSLHLRAERDPSKVVKTMTSSAPIVTFCNRVKAPPSESAPLRVFLSLVPVRDPERAARGQKVWSIKALPAARPQGEDGNVPF